MLRDKLVKSLIFALYTSEATTEVHTDASVVGLAGILLQKHADNKLQPVAYYSRQTNSPKTKYYSYKLKSLAAVESLKKLCSYLLDIEFTVVTDCNALKATKDKIKLFWGGGFKSWNSDLLWCIDLELKCGMRTL